MNQSSRKVSGPAVYFVTSREKRFEQQAIVAFYISSDSGDLNTARVVEKINELRANLIAHTAEVGYGIKMNEEWIADPREIQAAFNKFASYIKTHGIDEDGICVVKNVTAEYADQHFDLEFGPTEFERSFDILDEGVNFRVVLGSMARYKFVCYQFDSLGGARLQIAVNVTDEDGAFAEFTI